LSATTTKARLARLPSSRNAVHRGLWIPNLRAGDDPASGTRSPGLFEEVKLPEAYRPRGSAIAA
jgi:hypothetical protein